MQDLHTIASSHIALRANRNGTRLLNALIDCVAKLVPGSKEHVIASELIDEVYGNSMVQPPRTGPTSYTPTTYRGPRFEQAVEAGGCAPPVHV